jgi:hypothetical protein
MATIFEAFESQERGGDRINCRRSIDATFEGRWKFRSSGEPYAFEDLSRYEARRVRDRFTPEHLGALLAGLGAPSAPLPEARPLTAVLFVRDSAAPHLARFSYAQVQTGVPWQRA